MAASNNKDAFLIGCANGLNLTDEDVELMASWLGNDLGFNVEECQNRCCTEAQIYGGFEKLFREPGLKVIFYSGHGTASSNSEGWVLHKWVLWDRLLKENIQLQFRPDEQQLVIIVDCCHGDGTVEVDGMLRKRNSPLTGEIITPKVMPYANLQNVEGFEHLVGPPSYPGPTVVSRITDFDERMAAITIAACKKDELSTESSSVGNGVFTHYLVQNARSQPSCNYIQLGNATARLTDRYDQTTVVRGNSENLKKPILSTNNPLVWWANPWA